MPAAGHRPGRGAALHATTLRQRPRRYITDNFNRADSSTNLGTASDGGTWTTVGGTWGISSNQAYIVTTAVGATTFGVYRINRRDSGQNAADVQIDNARQFLSAQGILFCAHNSTTGDGYFILFTSSSSVELHKYIGGVDSTLATYTGTAWTNSSTTLRLTHNGGILRVFQNGTLLGTFTDSSSPLTGTSNTLVGFGTTSAFSNETFDNFTAVSSPIPIILPPWRPTMRSRAINRASVI